MTLTGCQHWAINICVYYGSYIHPFAGSCGYRGSLRGESSSEVTPVNCKAAVYLVHDSRACCCCCCCCSCCCDQLDTGREKKVRRDGTTIVGPITSEKRGEKGLPESQRSWRRPQHSTEWHQRILKRQEHQRSLHVARYFCGKTCGDCVLDECNVSCVVIKVVSGSWYLD